MKKIKILLLAILTFFTLNKNVFATSASLSTSSSSVYVGDTFTVSVNVFAAAWNVHTSVSGPVSGCIVNQSDASADAMNTNKTFTATCTATGEGTITITLYGDVTGDADIYATTVSGTRTVTVSKKPASSGNNNSSNNNSNNSNNNTTSKSSNNKIKEISVEGYDLVKEDDNNYTLTVPTDVTSINVLATAEDAKANVTGTGNHNLVIGDNNIEVIVTSESGRENKINIKVTRKDGYYLEDLENVLDNTTIEGVNINILSDTIISSEQLDKIKSSKKIVNLNYNDNRLIYSWIIDGSLVDNSNDFLTTISYDSNNKSDMLRLSNYADGLFISASGSSAAPDGTKIRLYVGDKYSDGELVNIYTYSKDADELNLDQRDLEVTAGYITFNASETSDYLVTMSNITSISKNVSEVASSSNLIYIIIIALLLLVIAVLSFFMIRSKIKKKTLSNSKESEEML